MSSSGSRRSRRAGFTLLELLVVVTITGVLGSLAILSFSTVQGRMGARSAQSNFLSMHAQTRAFAVERGGPARLVIDTQTNELRIEAPDPDGNMEIVNRLDLAGEFNVNLTLNSGSTTTPAIVCFTPRGVADPGCGTISQVTVVRFSRGNRTADVQLLVLGQARAV
jgi:prepilin-type N-terminal cleavage/methylation domain-containing protein